MNYKFEYKHIKSKLAGIFHLVKDFIFLSFRLPYKTEYSEASILYFGEYFPARIQRIVKHLQSNNRHNLILYISSWGYEPKLIGNYFDRVETYRNKFDLKRKLKRERNVQLIHAFEPKAYYHYLVKKWLTAPYIYDSQDIIITYFGMNPPEKWQIKNLLFEKKVLEAADGFIAHSLELNEALRLHEVKNKKPRLFFPLYCDDSNFKPIKSAPYHLETPELVYIGGINGLSEKSSSNFLPFIESVQNQNLNFTIFPSPAGETLYYRNYKALETQFSNFSIEKTVAFAQLDLSPYHFGVIPFEHHYSETYLSKNKYASTLKFFVYLDMGLPIIVSEYWSFPAWICKRYGLGLVTRFAHLPDLEAELKALDYNKILSNIEHFRNKFVLKNEVLRLKSFYERFLTSEI